MFVFTPTRDNIDYIRLELALDDIVPTARGSFAHMIRGHSQLPSTPGCLFRRARLPHTHASQNVRLQVLYGFP